MINGTNGAFFHPLVTKDETLYMFSSDLCRWARDRLDVASALAASAGANAAPHVRVSDD